MDSIPQNEEVSRAVLALLVAQTAHDLSVWGQWQNELGAEFSPKSDEIFTQQPIVVAQRSTDPRSTDPLAPVIQPAQQPVANPVPPVPQQIQSKPAPAASKASANSHVQNCLATFSAFQRASAVAPPADPVATKQQLDMRIQNCRQCSMGTRRTGVLCGYGPLNAQMLIICAGGNPYEFDAKRVIAGKSPDAEVTVLFDNIIKAMTAVNPQISADTIYFTNAIKCCAIPPRATIKQVLTGCSRYLREEALLVNPKVILVFGQTAYDAVFGDGQSIITERGKVRRFEQIPTVVTHHPMECLKNRELKKRVWDDVRTALHVIKSGS